MSEYPPPNSNYGTVFNPIDWPGKDQLNNIEVVNRINNGIVYYETDGRIYTKDKFVFDNYKIGLNTNAPNAMIDIKNINNNDYLRLLNPSNEYKFYIDSNGNTSINSNNSNGYNLYVSGTAYIKDLDTDNIIINNTTIGSNLYVDGNTILKGTLNVTGNTLLNGNLDVSGVSTLNGNVFLKGLVGSNSLLFLSQSTKQILTDNNLTFNPSANLLTVIGDANIREDLIVSGTSHLIDANINNNLFVSGNSTLRGNLLITGNTEIKNILSVSGTTNLIDANINNNLFVSGNSTLRNSLLVSGNSDLRGTLNVSNISTLRNTNIIGNLGVNQSNALTQLQFSDENVYHIRFDSVSAPAPRYYKLTSMNYGGQIVGSFRIYGTLSGDQSNDRGSSIINIRFSNRTSASGDAPTLVGSVFGSVGNVANILIYKNTVSLTYDVYLFVNTFCLVDINIQRIGANAPLSYDASYITSAPSGVTNIYNMQTRFSDTTVNDSILYKSTNKDEFILNRTYSTAGWYLITSILFVNSFIAGLWINGFIGGDELARGNANINLTFKCKNNTQDDPIIYGSCFGQLNNAYNDILIYKNTTTSTYDVYLYQGQFVNNYITFSKFVGSTNNITISSVPNYTTTPPGTLAYRLSDNFSTISNNVFYQGVRTGFGIGTATPFAGLHVSNTSILQNGVSMRSTLHVAGASTLLSTLNVNNNTVLVGATSLNSTLHVAGASTFLSNLNVGTNSVLVGATSLNSTLHVGGATTLLSTLNVNNNTVLVGATSLNSTLHVAGATTFLSTLNVSGNTTINNITTNSLLVNGAVSMGSTLDLDNDVYDYSNITLNFKTATIDAPNSSWTSICWSPILKMFVAVGRNTVNNNQIINSYDGITWSIAKSLSTTLTFQCVIWASDRFIACASDGTNATNRIILSYDGLYWFDTTTLSVSNTWKYLCYAYEINTVVCCADTGASGRIIYSTDRGITWSIGSGYVNTSAYSSIAWSPDNKLFVVTATSGSSPQGTIYRSSDGITWTVSNIATAYQWESICWATRPINRFVIVSSTSGASQRSLYSSDGINWTFSTSSPTIPLNTWKYVTYNNYLSRLIACSSDGTNRIMTSTDGNNWTQITIGTNNFVSINFNDSKTLLISSNVNLSNNIVQSTDLITFTQITNSGLSDAYYIGIDYNPSSNKLIACASLGTTRVIQSTNEGYRWTTNSLSSSYQWLQVIYAGNKWVAVNSATAIQNEHIAYSSDDGVTWSFSSIPQNNAWDTITYSSSLGRYVSLSSSGTTRVMYSSDAITWINTSASIIANNWISVKWIPEISLFYATANNGLGNTWERVARSTNGLTWTYMPTTFTYTNNFVDIAYSPLLNRFVLISNDGVGLNAFITSQDGLNWSNANWNGAFPNSGWGCIDWSPDYKKFVACNNSSSTNVNRFLWSSDGFNWYPITYNIPDYPYSFIKYIPTLKKFLVLASSGADFYKRFLFSYEPTDGFNNACLRVNNTTKGILMPSLTDIQQNITTNPTEGMLFYNNTLKNLSFFNGSSFISPLTYIYYTSSMTVISTTVTSGNPYQTDLFITVTPKTLNSKFYITCNVNIGGSFHTAYMLYKSIDSGTYRKVGTAKIGNRFIIEGRQYIGNDGNAMSTITNTTLDIPNTILPITYRVYITGNESPAVLTFNRSRTYNDNGNIDGTQAYSTMIIYETI